MRPAASRSALFVLLASLFAVPSFAAQVTNLTALVQHGQTFVTWTCPPGTGLIYHIFASARPILTASDLAAAEEVAVVGDSSSVDRRLSALTGTTYTYAIKSGSPPLTVDQGLFVNTSPVDQYTAYAVIVQSLLVQDRTITLGQNSMRRSIRESVQSPVPVLQRTLPWSGVAAEIYTLWTSSVPTALFRPMGNVPGLAFDCAVVPPASAGTSSSLVVLPHRKSGNFLENLVGTGTPGEWVLALDDPIPNQDANTFWYGYHENYDITSDANYPPIDGMVRDYTLQRILYTLGWARSTLPIDTTRVYAYGGSMGGIGSCVLAFNKPEWIAAVLSNVGKYDFSFVADPNPLSSFNTGNPLRGLVDKLWGDVTTNLVTNPGRPIYHVLNDGALAGEMEPISIPPIFSYNGKWDTTVGWAEKIPFYAAMRNARQAGFFFWDQRDHMGTATSAWGAGDPSSLYQFRTNLSFPALTSCSIDGNPGNGDPMSGDSIGTINGFLGWDPDVVDEPTRWEVTLQLHDVSPWGQTVTAPDSATVDMTPRRLQHFVVMEGLTFHYTATRITDGAVVRDGYLTQGDSRTLTLFGIPVYKGGTHVSFEAQGSAGVAPTSSSPLRLRLSRNPVRPGSAIELAWPAGGDARVDLLDVAGRRVRVLFRGAVHPGDTRISFGGADLPNGVYMIDARLGALHETARAIVMH